MGGRYFITRIQIDMIRAFTKQENEHDVNKLLNKVEKEQFLREEKEEKRPKKINQIRR